MTMTNVASGTNVHEIADGIFRINTPVELLPGGFKFNQYLIADDEPILFHIGPRRMFPLVREALEYVLPVGRLRFVASPIRSRRMRFPECLAGRRTRSRSLLQPGRGPGFRERLCRPAGPCDGRWREFAWENRLRNGSMLRTCRMPGNVA